MILTPESSNQKEKYLDRIDDLYTTVRVRDNSVTFEGQVVWQIDFSMIDHTRDKESKMNRILDFEVKTNGYGKGNVEITSRRYLKIQRLVDLYRGERVNIHFHVVSQFRLDGNKVVFNVEADENILYAIPLQEVLISLKYMDPNNPDNFDLIYEDPVIEKNSRNVTFLEFSIYAWANLKRALKLSNLL